MERYLYADYTRHLSNESSAMFRRVLGRRNLAQMLIWLLSMHSSIITVTRLFAGLVWQAPIPSLAVLAANGSTGLLVYRMVKDSVDTAGDVNAEATQEENRAVLAATEGTQEVLIYPQQPAFLEALARAVAKGIPSRVFISTAQPMPSWILVVVGFALVSASGGMLVIMWDASIEHLTTLVALLTLTAWRALPYLHRTVSSMVAIRGTRPVALPAIELLGILRAQEIELLPPPDPRFRFEREIRLENVRHRYPESMRGSLWSLTFTIPRGAQVGLIGPSGAGKSTLAGVLSGLLAPISGYILVDGESLIPARSEAHRFMVGSVPAESVSHGLLSVRKRSLQPMGETLGRGTRAQWVPHGCR